MTTTPVNTEWYVVPEDCDRCYAQETIANDYGIDWTIETTHETNCPNHPHNQERNA
jgi:hypothetical protein